MELSLIQKICIWTPPLIFAITLHEVAHGWVASKLGDQTARLSGRLTLNPIKHIDLVGTIIMPVIFLLTTNIMFGMAKPVPVNQSNLRNPRRDMCYVALAGPAANLAMAIIWALVARLSMNMPSWFAVPITNMGLVGVQINIMLAVLNCLPIPPLDGSRIVSNLLPPGLAWKYNRIEPYGLIILLILIFSNVLYFILVPPFTYLVKVIYHLFGI